jgi:DNA-directed RNA polymerase specialized sigma24 family protein
MACTGRILVWWDRDFDSGGRPIRPDVRLAGQEIWEQACRQTRAVVSDDAPAAELMENAVAQVSRYLDRVGAPLSSRKHGLLMLAFRRALRRYAFKLARLELVGGSDEFSNYSSTDQSIARVEARLALESIIRWLSERNADVLLLRAAGYEWREIGSMLGVSTAAVRNRFWREIEQLRWKLAGRLFSR